MNFNQFINEPSIYYLFKKLKNNFNDNYNKYYNKNNNKKEIILLGKGWLAKGFTDYIDKKKYNIINIYKNDFSNSPMLLPKIKYNNNFIINNNKSNNTNEFIKTIKKIDLENNIIITDIDEINFKNKILVVGLGNNYDISEYWNNNINNIKQMMEENKLGKNICVIGAGITGTELSFHLNDIGCNITLLDKDKLDNLYSYISKDGKDKILNKLYKNNINLLTEKTFDKSNHNYDYYIFATGFIPNKLTIGWETNKYLQLNNNPNIFIGGDCAHNNLPKNAQIAYQQGKFIARYLNNKLSEDEIKNGFTYKNKSVAIYIGNNQYYIETNIFNKNIKITIPEFFVHFYYLFLN